MILSACVVGLLLQLAPTDSVARWCFDILLILVGLVCLWQVVRRTRGPVLTRHGLLAGLCLLDLVAVGLAAGAWMRGTSQGPWLAVGWGPGLLIALLCLWDIQPRGEAGPVRGRWGKRAAALLAVGLLLSPLIVTLMLGQALYLSLPLFPGDLPAWIACGAWEPYLAWRLFSETGPS